MRARLLASLLLVTASSAAGAQAVLDTEAALVEVRGLDRWTIAMIVDSLARHAPKESLASHACAAVLRQKLGFADAAVLVYPRGFEGRTRAEFYVTVVEPHDSARVRYLPAPTQERPLPPEWQPLAERMRDDFESYQAALRDPATLAAHAPSDGDGRADARRPAVRDALRTAIGARGAGTHREALGALRSARSAEQRALAASVLVAWPEHDVTWHALVEAQRDPSALVRTVAGQSLRGLLAGSPRAVDWRPATASLRALLDGTNLFAFDLVLDVLATTANGAQLRRPLLAGGGDLVLELLQSREPAARVRAYRFLRAMGGTDLGTTAEPWRRWITSL